MTEELKKKKTYKEWAAILFGIASIILGIIIAIMFELSDTLHPYEIDSKTIASILLGIVIGVPLLIVGGIQLSKKTKYNEKLEDIQLRSLQGERIQEE